jgi:methyltransferase family protein
VNPPDDLLPRVELLLGSRAVSFNQRFGGYSIAERWSLELADGRRVFTKLAPTDDLAWRLRDEYKNMSAIDDDFMCDVIAWEDTERPLLVLEDLSDARWPPPWEPGDIDRVLATLERIWSTEPPPHVPSAERVRSMFAGWEWVAQAPEGFLSLGLTSRAWLDRSLPTLVGAARSCVLEGDDLLHFDVRSDNLCFAGDRVVFVDWNWAVVGPRELDLACWLAPLRLEGGPLPEEVAPGLGTYAAGFSAFMAAQAPLPPPEGAPTVRKFQLRQLRVSLPWACRELGLPEPDLMWAMDELAPIDKALEDGLLTDAQWYAQTEEVLADAYLSYAEPWKQSGKGGDDEEEWRWARELVFDTFAPEHETFLDIGCANGYLMESMHRWGAERGKNVEPYGLDISWRLAALARYRLPHWADRIFTGNALDWTPPRRFDVVNFGVEYVPPPRRRELIEHLLNDVLVPGGRLVLRPERLDPNEPSPAERFAAIGFDAAGTSEAVHPRNAQVRRTAWLQAPLG